MELIDRIIEAMASAGALGFFVGASIGITRQVARKRGVKKHFYTWTVLSLWLPLLIYFLFIK